MGNNLIPLRIAGVGYSLPETVITNEDLTKLYDTSDEWIYTRTGIKERRVVSGEENAIDLGYQAAKNAIEKSGIDIEEIDLILAASSAPPDLYPAIACHIHQRLGIQRQIPAFDITAACSGLIYGLSIAKAYINIQKTRYHNHFDSMWDPNEDDVRGFNLPANATSLRFVVECYRNSMQLTGEFAVAQYD